MKRLALLIAAIMTATLLSSPAEARSKGRIVVIGDSVSDLKTYKGSGNNPKTIWWKRISRAAHLTPYVHAERGSGYSKPGKCVGTTIGQRINHPKIARRLKKAAVVVIAAGINDRHECIFHEGGGHHVIALKDELLEAAIAQAMIDLDALVKDNTRVYITVPIGPRPKLKPYRKRITTLLSKYAAQHGFTYVKADGGVLGGKRTSDGVHPNAAGHKALYRHLYLKTSMSKRYPRH